MRPPSPYLILAIPAGMEESKTSILHVFGGASMSASRSPIRALNSVDIPNRYCPLDKLPANLGNHGDTACADRTDVIRLQSETYEWMAPW
jgi:hypothetical protein